MLIGAQAFRESPPSHAPAIVLASDAARGGLGRSFLIDNSLGAAGTNAAAVGPRQARPVGVLLPRAWRSGWAAARSWADLVLGAIAAFVIDGPLRKAAGFALAGPVLTFFGFMHGEAIGFGQTPLVALAYLIVAGLLLGCARSATVAQPAPHADAAPAPGAASAPAPNRRPHPAP